MKNILELVQPIAVILSIGAFFISVGAYIQSSKTTNAKLSNRITEIEGNNIYMLPVGAVVAFNASKCPEKNWKEYELAYGRFVRGIDKGAKRTDPEGGRVAGSQQPDQIQSHRHRIQDGLVQNFGFIPQGNNLFTSGSGSGVTVDNFAKTTAPLPDARFGSETRPKNVALLYCLKTQ